MFSVSLIEIHILIKNIVFVKILEKTKLTMNDRVRSGMPVSLTQASITPWISAVIVEPEEGWGFM